MKVSAYRQSHEFEKAIRKKLNKSSGQLMASIAVLGLGNWGTALAHHLARRGNKVLAWSVEADVVSGINNNHRNPRYLTQIELHPNLSATADISATFVADVIVLVIPSTALHDVLPALKLKTDAILVSAVKGIDPESLKTPLQLAADYLPATSLAVISGPSFAKDVAAECPCGIVAASASIEVATKVASIFSGNGMKVYLSTDPLGVELGGIVKNVIALAAGVGDGLGLGESARAGLITRGLAEIMRLAEAMGADRQTLSGLSGLGDLAMTATSTISRNHRVGIELGKGHSLKEAISLAGSVAEGVTTTPSVLKLAQKYRVEMPIVEEAARLLEGKVTPLQAVQNLLNRPVREEF
jgi:glycerol-3-phosphate dehydrogenase (NAD(P)+)